jgi:hypothetical protein
VFNVIGFVYPGYCFPTCKRRIKRKSAATTSSTAPKAKEDKSSNSLAEVVLLRKGCNTACAETSKTEATEAAEETLLAPEVILLFFLDLNRDIFYLMLRLEFFA